MVQTSIATRQQSYGDRPCLLVYHDREAPRKPQAEPAGSERIPWRR
jgi:hypothetical protein